MLVKMMWNPSDRQLRQFGLCALAALPLMGWIALGHGNPATWDPGQRIAFAAVAAIGVLGGLVAWRCPARLKYPFIIASLATIPIGLVVGELMLLIVYFGIFTPVALFFKLIGRDALERRWDPAAPSYWARKAPAATSQQYFRQS